MATIRSLRGGRGRRVAASLSSLSTAGLHAIRWRRRRTGAADRNVAAFGQAHETGRYNPLIRLKTALNDGLDFVLLLDRDRSHRHGIVVLDNVDKGAIRAALDCAGWDHDHLLKRVDEQANVHELAGPELQIDVRKFSFQ